MKGIYKLLGYFWAFKALRRGPGSFVRQRIRSKLLKYFSKNLKRYVKL